MALERYPVKININTVAADTVIQSPLSKIVFFFLKLAGRSFRTWLATPQAITFNMLKTLGDDLCKHLSQSLLNTIGQRPNGWVPLWVIPSPLQTE